MVVKLQGAQALRQRLVCATLAGTVLRVDEIRAKSQSPGLREHEASFLRLLEKISSGCIVEINETGTKLKYKPGVLVGGRGLVHDCGTRRAIGYFLEPLLVLALFGKRPLSITLKGITNDEVDACVDTCRTTTLPLLKHFGVPAEELELKVVQRGAPPLGGGEVLLKVPTVNSLQPVHWLDEGMVKRVRGVAYSTRVSPQMANRMVDAARGVLNALLPDVYIFTDHYTGQESGRSPGYGISLVAETTSGCLISAECAAEQLRRDDASGAREAKGAVLLPEEVGEQVARQLLQEIERGGVVDSTHQALLFLLCAMCPEDICKVRSGPLTPQGMQMLRDIKEIVGVQFNLRPDPASGTVLLSCVGSGLRNLSRKIS